MTSETPDDIVKRCIKAYKQEDPEDARILNLCEKLGLLTLTEISVALDKRFEEYLDYLNKHESLSVKDLDQRNMTYVLINYFKKNHEAEREVMRLMETQNDFKTETDLQIITEFMSGVLEDLELNDHVIPDDVFEEFEKTKTKTSAAAEDDRSKK